MVKWRRRKGGILIFGSHLFKQKESEELCKQETDAIVVGIGTNGVARISDDARKFIESKQIKLIELLSEQAIKEFNRLVKDGEKVGAIIHVAC